jgi:hypothetical protein
MSLQNLTLKPSHPEWLWFASIPLIVLGGFLMLLGLMFGAIVISRQLDLLGALILFALALILVPSGAGCLNLGRRFFTVRTEYEALRMLQANVPPVLYLRSFRDDSIAARKLAGAQRTVVVPGFGRLPYLKTEEEALSKILSQLGPPIAIGLPGERLPSLGVPRLYVEGAEWEDHVKTLMLAAQLVVIRAGATEGLWREIKMARDHVRLERLVFLLPFGYEYEQYYQFCVQIKKVLGCELPTDYRFGTREWFMSVTDILHFVPDGAPHLISLADFVLINKINMSRGKPLETLFASVLYPVVTQLRNKEAAN